MLNQEYALVDSSYSVGLTPTGNLKFNLGESSDEFTLKMKQGIWTSITLHKEDIVHLSWMEELWVSRFIHLSFVASYLYLEPC